MNDGYDKAHGLTKTIIKRKRNSVLRLTQDILLISFIHDHHLVPRPISMFEACIVKKRREYYAQCTSVCEKCETLPFQW